MAFVNQSFPKEGGRGTRDAVNQYCRLSDENYQSTMFGNAKTIVENAVEAYKLLNDSLG